MDVWGMQPDPRLVLTFIRTAISTLSILWKILKSQVQKKNPKWLVKGFPQTPTEQGTVRSLLVQNLALYHVLRNDWGGTQRGCKEPPLLRSSSLLLSPGKIRDSSCQLTHRHSWKACSALLPWERTPRLDHPWNRRKLKVENEVLNSCVMRVSSQGSAEGQISRTHPLLFKHTHVHTATRISSLPVSILPQHLRGEVPGHPLPIERHAQVP